MEEENQILVCKKCGSQNVESSAWVAVNNNNRFCDYLGLEDVFNNWCCDCEEHVSLITLDEYEKYES
jgi:hypothetical protein